MCNQTFKAVFERTRNFTVKEMQWSGIKNGKLLSLCAENGFDILLTIDKNLQHQQNLEKYSITIVVLNSYNSTEEELVLFLPALRAQLPNFQKHKAYVINKND